MKTEHKIIALSVGFFVLVSVIDAFVDSFVFHGPAFWSSLVFDVPEIDVYHRALVAACFLVFGFVVSRVLKRQRRAEEALTDRTAKLAELNARLTEEIAERKKLEEALRAEENRYRTVADFTYDWEFWVGPDGKFKWVAPSCKRVTGYSAEEFIQDTALFHNIIHADDRDMLMRHTTGSLRHERDSSCSLDFRIVRRDGEVRWINHVCQPVYTDDNRLLGRRASNRDVTERRRIEVALREEEARFRYIYENSPVMMHSIDRQGIVRNVNGKWLEEMGYSREEVLGHNIEFALTPESVKSMLNDIRPQLWRNGQVKNVEYQYVKKDGTVIDVVVEATVMNDPTWGRVSLSAVRNVTERKKAQRDLIEAREAAEQASRAKSEFLANISHEIRTPINGIIGMTELTLNTQLTSEQQEYLETVQMSAESLLSLINDFLDFSRIEAGKLDLVAMDFSLRDFMGNTMSTLAVHAHRKGLELIYHVPSTTPDALKGDPGRLRQVLVNVVGNAVKFTDKGEVVVRVVPDSEQDNEVRLHFTVTDTGIGIPVDKQQKIFHTFEQVDTSTSRKYGGTGLGLAISSQLVEKMGGNIWVESELNKGSTFHFVVSLGLQKPPAETPIFGDTGDLKDLSLLVVDDNATNRRILEETVLQWGMKPTVVDSGQTALAAMEVAYNVGRPFKLVLTDCMMPGMDGFQLAERINSDSRLKAATIIMLTSAGERGDASRCVNLGISAYLLKPIKQSELLFTLSKVVHAHQPGPAGQTLITRHSIRESGRRLRILLAEDNPVNQTVAAKMLERMGHGVSIAENGREALEALEKQGFDLVLMDIQMPEVDGFEATRIVRERETATGEHLPIIAMTAHAMKGDKEKCFEGGMDGYIAKPINAEQLFETIEDLFRWRKAANRLSEVLAAGGHALDTTRILERIGGDRDLLKELAALFVRDCPKMLSDIRDAVREGSAEALQMAAHALKGSVSNFAADAAVQAASRLETMARNRDMMNTSQALKELEQETDRVLESLSALADGSEQ
jgi:PAS domain S-box-containing protein